jgi:hypothetical protein
MDIYELSDHVFDKTDAKNDNDEYARGVFAALDAVITFIRLKDKSEDSSQVG